MIKRIKRTMSNILLSFKSLVHLHERINLLDEKVVRLGDINEQLSTQIDTLLVKLSAHNSDGMGKFSIDAKNLLESNLCQNDDFIRRISTNAIDLLGKSLVQNEDIVRKISEDVKVLLENNIVQHNDIVQATSVNSNNLIEKLSNKNEEIQHLLDEKTRLLEINTAYTKEMAENILNIEFQINSVNNAVNSNQEFERLQQSIYNYSQEFKMLEQANMNLLIKFLSDNKSNSRKKISLIGHYSIEIKDDFDKNDCEVECFVPSTIENIIYKNIIGDSRRFIFPYAIKDNIEISDKIIITNAAFSKVLLNDYGCQSITQKVKNELIILVPNPTTSEENISVVWDDGFSALEKSENNIYHRWFVNYSNKASLFLLNKSNKLYDCKLSFYINSLDTSSQITISINNKKKMINMLNGYEKVLFDIELQAGINEIGIEYFGKAVQLKDSERKLKFSVADLRIESNHGVDIVGFDAHKTKFDNANPYSYLSDEFLRSVLHKNGFFEIDSFLCSRNRKEILPISRSRYLDFNQSYYFVKEEQVTLEEGVRVYIARRKGEMHNG